MKLEDQVCTLEQAKRLKELGVLQEAVWFWVFPAKERMISSNKGLHYHDLAKEIVEGNEGTEFDHDNCAAFTVAELGVMLGTEVSMPFYWKLWEGFCFKAGGQPQGYGTEAEARAALLIFRLQTNLTTPEEVNNRLNP